MSRFQERVVFMVFSLLVIFILRTNDVRPFTSLPGVVVFPLVIIMTMMFTASDEKPSQPGRRRYIIQYFRQTVWTRTRIEEKEILQVQEENAPVQMELADKKSIPANCRQTLKNNRLTTWEE